MKKIKRFLDRLICALHNHPHKVLQERHTSQYYPKQDYVEYYCSTCNEMIPSFEPHQEEDHTEHAH